MRVFLGICRTLSFLVDSPGNKNFWCVGGASRLAAPGDQILLYFPVAVSHTRNGIGQVYQVISKPTSLRTSPCADFAMAHVDTQLLLTLRQRVTMKDMKANAVVRQWGAVQRNMQGVTFLVSQDVWPTLRSMIVERNPEADSVLVAAF